MRIKVKKKYEQNTFFRQRNFARFFALSMCNVTIRQKTQKTLIFLLTKNKK